MSNTEIKQKIHDSIKSFASGSLTDNALNIFSTLGYITTRQNPFTTKTYKYFKDTYIENNNKFNEDKALFSEWKYIDLLFQLSEEEVSSQTSLFDTKRVDHTVIETYLFFIIELSENNYSRTTLSNITREMNKVFPMPVMVLFKHGESLTLSIINRRLHKRDEQKDVLEKVTLIKDISISNPHRAHVEILFDLSFEELLTNHGFTNFVELHNAWQKTLNLSELNEKFYKDLQDWFYFASHNIKLPFKPEYIDSQENIKNFLVRLLGRTMFCWFVKEKGLIQPELLELTDWNNIRYNLTVDINDKNFLKSNSYYRGVLQNIFFNALNKSDKKNKKDFKWTKYLPADFNYDILLSIPYLNGGIFDTLDEDNAKESIEDSVIKIPNYLFYGITEKQKITTGKGENKEEQISTVVHKGLNEILKSYKFTLEENTPLEEDIALDPELLGLVFENLLAELDPNLEESTISSIRRQTGSYYTPRKVIQEMVNESLYLYLSKYIEKNHPGLAGYKKDLADIIYHQVSTNEKTSECCEAVVSALDKFKVLDPACGSGAFPMGMLHRMVDILKAVDPDNKIWLGLKLKGVDSTQRVEFKKILTLHLDDYGRKLGIIRDSIYGIDIQPMAVQITKLRFFITLLIDQNIEKGITPMPNIETKIICADSLKNIQAGLFSSDAINQLKEARRRFYQPDISYQEREKITEEIVVILDQAFPDFAEQITGKKIKGQNKELIRHWFTHATIAAPFFNMDFFYPELGGKGFDCVIGNPPYGGKKISDEIRQDLDIESKDPYGAFIARFINEPNSPTPLKHGGVLAYIVSDTFMTIKSHLKLRKHIMQNYIHKMLRVNPDTFKATVNTAIIIFERNTNDSIDPNHICQMADMTNISIHDNYEHFVDVLHQTEGVDFSEADIRKAVSNAEYAIYYYPQSLIKTNSNLPLFVASPKLFALMNDGNDLENKSDSEWNELGGKKVQVRSIPMNDSIVKIVKLGDVGSAPHGISTGNNKKYVRAVEGTKGSYDAIEDWMICSESEINTLSEKDKINGLNKDWKLLKRCFVPFEKGGESDSGDGWMPNYYVPTTYYINWAKGAINDMRKNPGFRWFNVQYFFRKGLTFSISGIYAPTFRLNSGGVFEAKGSGLFCDIYDDETLLGFIASKLAKFIFKNYIKHSVDTSGDDIASFVLLSNNKHNNIKLKVASIIKKQKSDPRYDYASNEQIEIDKLVYEAYGLNAEDIEEVENWYARRYPKLSSAQKANLRALGKSDDYLVLYGLKKEK